MRASLIEYDRPSVPLVAQVVAERGIERVATPFIVGSTCIHLWRQRILCSKILVGRCSNLIV